MCVMSIFAAVFRVEMSPASPLTTKGNWLTACVLIPIQATSVAAPDRLRL